MRLSIGGTALKRTLLTAVAIISLGMGTAFAAQVEDWHQLDAVHNHVVEAINEMQAARAANHYDMSGHGAKAEKFLHKAEKELRLAIESAKAGK
jgi:hypothetical protein